MSRFAMVSPCGGDGSKEQCKATRRSPSSIPVLDFSFALITTTLQKCRHSRASAWGPCVIEERGRRQRAICVDAFRPPLAVAGWLAC